MANKQNLERERIVQEYNRTDQAPQRMESHDPLRRALLRTFGSAAGLFALSSATGAHAAMQEAASSSGDTESDEIFNAYNRIKTFDNDELNSGTPWVAPQHGNFDVEDPVQNTLMRLKMTNNLVGERTYIPMLVRLMIGREQYPGGPFLGAAGMFTWQLQVPDPELFPDIPEGTALLRSLYTSVYLDPATMEPVEELLNPYNGKIMKLEDQIFIENFLSYPKGGSKLIEEPQFSNDDPDTPKLRHIKAWGDELVLFQGGVYDKPGIHQPRFTENMWASPLADVMNPDVSLVDTRYTFTGLNKAYEKPWAGYSTDDNDVICDLAYGKKVHSIDAIPDFHKRVLVEKYPDRV